MSRPLVLEESKLHTTGAHSSTILKNKPRISRSSVRMREMSEFQDITQEIDLPTETIHDNVLITPSYMKFKDAIEGITLRECLTIRNIGNKIAFVRIHEPNSIALKIKTMKRGMMLSPGLAIKRWLSYSFKQPALLHALIPIEINGNIIDYQIICVFNVEYIEISPTSVDFGVVDIGCSSGMRLLTISNTGGKSTRFTVDLGNNDMDINVKPHRGVVRPQSTVQLHVRMIGINEGTFLNEFWIKSMPNIRVPVKAKIIIPRLEIDYPNTTGDFTLVDFSSTFYGVKKYDTLTLKNMSSQFSSFVVLAEIGNQLIPIEEVDLVKYPKFEVFEINPVEGRLESFHNIKFVLSFYPAASLMNREYKISSTQDFMIFIRIVRVHCTEVEDILRADNRTEPKPDDPPLHKVHIQDDSTVSSDSSASAISLVHRNAELVRLCLYGEAEMVQLRFIPNELYMKIPEFHDSTTEIIQIKNLSAKSAVTVIYVKSEIASCSPSEFLALPQNSVEVMVKISGRKHCQIEGTFNLNFNVFVDTAKSQSENIKIKIASYTVKCSLRTSMKKIRKQKIIYKTAEKISNDDEFPYRLIEIEKYNLQTLKSLGLTNSNKSGQSLKSIDTTKMLLSPLQIYHVKVSPTIFTFGSVAQRAPSYQELTFDNQNKFSVMVRLASLSAKNIRFLSGDMIILKSNQSITKVVEFRGDQVGRFNSYIDYVINDHHTYELALTADVNYKYLTLSTREIILGSDYLPQESYRPICSYLQLKNKLNARTSFKWEISTTASYIIDPSIGSVRGKRNLWINVLHVSDFIRSDQAEAVVICEGGHQATLRINTIFQILQVAFLNEIIDVGEIGLNLPHKVKSILHNAGNNEVLFQIDSSGLPDGCDVYPQHGIILPHGIKIIYVILKFRACLQFTITINVIVQKRKTLTLKIKGEVAFPKIKFTPNNIDIGRISASSYKIYQLSATNRGNVSATLRFPLDEFPEFLVALVTTQLNYSGQDNVIITISPNETRVFYLHFQPINLASYAIYLPIIINDILGPVIWKNFDTLRPKSFLNHNEILYKNFGGMKLIDIPTVLPKINIEGTVIGQILTYNKLHFSFDAEKNTLDDVLKICNSSILETSFTVHIDKQFDSKSPFSVEWNSGKELTPDSNTESFKCFLLPKEEIYFRINFKPIDQGFFTAEITVSALGELDTKMFNIINLEGKKSKPSILSQTNEIFFTPIPLMIKAEDTFHVTLNNFPMNTVIIGDVEEPQKYSGTFNKHILTITFPSGNIILTNTENEEMTINLSLRSKYSVSFQTRIIIHDENNEDRWFITIYGIVDNCLLTTHAYRILSNEHTKTDKINHVDTHQPSYPSLHSELSENESKTPINRSQSRVSDSQHRFSTHSELNHTGGSLRFSNESKLKSSLENNNIEDEIEISVIHEPKVSSTPSNNLKAQHVHHFTHPLFPPNLQIEYEKHMRRTIDAVEKWMYSDPLKYQFNLDVTCGITAVYSGLCSIQRASSEKRKIHTVDKSFLNVLIAIYGREIYQQICIPKSLPTDMNERINLILKTYDSMLTFLLLQNAHVSHINSKYLLNYDDYCAINARIVNIAETIFEARSRQSWLDIILQTYKQLVLSKIKANTITAIADDTKINQPIDIIRTVSSTSCVQLLTDADINIIVERAQEKSHFEPESILLAWLEYHFEQQCKEKWLSNDLKTMNFMEEKVNLQQKIIDNFEDDLIDSLVLITVTASYCPYLIDEYFDNIFINPKNPEEYLHNAICVVRAWRKIRLGFIIEPQEIVHPNSVQMLMLIHHLFQILPTYSPRSKVKFSCPLTEDIVRHIGFSNTSDSPVDLILEFFGNSSKRFSIIDADSMLHLNSHDSKTIKIKYHAKKMNETRAYLLVCGSAIGPNFTKNNCFILDGNTSRIDSINEYKIKSEMYSIVDKVISITVPYEFDTDYDIWISEEVPVKTSSLKMIRWSELRKKKIPRRLFINQKSLYVMKNARKANLSITLACMAPDTRIFWIIFQAKLGDFVIKITSIPKSSLVETINVEWDRKKCICILPKIVDTCPLNIEISIPSRNLQLWNCVKKIFQKSLNSREQTFWSKQLDTNIGLKLIHWLMESHEDNTAKEFLHIFNKSVDYTISVLDKQSNIIFPETFHIPDVRQLHENVTMKIHLSDTLSESYYTLVTFTSSNGREQRNYNIILTCKN